MLAPIVLFTYNRVAHTKTLINSLLANQEAADSDLYIFSDGSRNTEDEDAVQQVREYLHSISGFRSVTITEHPNNLGLAASVINGITAVLDENDCVIVLEDDLILSPYFLKFMNDALLTYADNPHVGCVNGHVLLTKNHGKDFFFVYHADSWGWGTWKRAWQLFNSDAQDLLNQIESKNLNKAFDLDGSYPFTKMLKRQIAGEINSWAIRWRASLFINGKISINAARSLVLDNGFDGTGTHCGKGSLFPTKLFSERPLVVDNITSEETIDLVKRLKVRYRWLNSKLHKGLVMLSNLTK